MPSSRTDWSWPAFAAGVAAAFVATTVLWFLVRVVLLVVVIAAIALAGAWFAGNGRLRWPRSLRRR